MGDTPALLWLYAMGPSVTSGNDLGNTVSDILCPHVLALLRSTLVQSLNKTMPVHAALVYALPALCWRPCLTCQVLWLVFSPSWTCVVLARILTLAQYQSAGSLGSCHKRGYSGYKIPFLHISLHVSRLCGVGGHTTDMEPAVFNMTFHHRMNKIWDGYQHP